MIEPEPTADEVHEAIASLIDEGLAERCVIDGVEHIRLTPAGMARAARVVERLAQA